MRYITVSSKTAVFIMESLFQLQAGQQVTVDVDVAVAAIPTPSAIKIPDRPPGENRGNVDKIEGNANNRNDNGGHGDGTLGTAVATKSTSTYDKILH